MTVRTALAALVAPALLAGCELLASGRPPAAGSLETVGPTTAARIVRVIDGDTFDVDVGGRRETVRLIGIDAPERARDGQPAEPLASEATDALADLLDDAPVVLEVDRSGSDRFGRWLRYAWQPTDGGWRLVNEELVRRGLADARPYPPDTARQRRLDAAEDEARDAGRGIWAAP